MHALLKQDYTDLEFVLKETEKQRREYAARCALSTHTQTPLNRFQLDYKQSVCGPCFLGVSQIHV